MRGFELFEEFSERSISEIVEERRTNLNRFDLEAKKQLEKEIESFCSWLKEVKGLHPNTAYYYSASLKSLACGLPIGVEVGLLFGIILDTRARESAKVA